VLIDWFTVVAQLINFLILLALLRHFLYGPIMRAMDERTQRIAAETTAAATLSAAAQAEIASYQQQQAALTAERQALLQAAEAEAETARQALLQTARAEVDELRQRWQQGLAAEAEDFLVDLQRRAGQEVLQIARQSLADLADAPLEEQMAAAFARELAALPADTWRTLLYHEPLVIVAASPLSPAARQQLAETVERATGGAGVLTFASEPALIGGLELRSQSHKIGWSLAGYLDQLAERFSTALDGHERVTA
jgi:F-type H+-transporting ATPase subunit b